MGLITFNKIVYRSQTKGWFWLLVRFMKHLFVKKTNRDLQKKILSITFFLSSMLFLVSSFPSIVFDFFSLFFVLLPANNLTAVLKLILFLDSGISVLHFNSLNAKVAIVYAMQINWLVSIWWQLCRLMS